MVCVEEGNKPFSEIRTETRIYICHFLKLTVFLARICVVCCIVSLLI